MLRTKGIVKNIIKIFLFVLLILALLIGAFITFLMLGKEKTLNIELKSIDLQAVADGTYTGHYNGYRWSNTVEVEVKNHQITNIIVKKPQVFAKNDTIQVLINRVMSEQALDVDAVSGATADSKAFLQAVENALNSSGSAS